MSFCSFGQLDVRGTFYNAPEGVHAEMYVLDEKENEWIFLDSITYEKRFYLEGLYLNHMYGIRFFSLKTSQEYLILINPSESGKLEDINIIFSKKGEPLDKRVDSLYHNGEEYKVATIL